MNLVLKKIYKMTKNKLKNRPVPFEIDFAEDYRDTKFVVQLSDSLRVRVPIEPTIEIEIIDNKYFTDEKVQKLKEKYAKTIVLSLIYNTFTNGAFQHYVELSPKDEDRSDEWRNTKEKIDKIKQYFKNYEIEEINETFEYLPKENIELLISQGWEFEGYCDDIEM